MQDNDKKSPGDHIRDFRLHLNLDQTEFATLIGSTQPTVSVYENYDKHKRSPEWPIALRMVNLAKQHNYPLTWEHLYEDHHSDV